MSKKAKRRQPRANKATTAPSACRPAVPDDGAAKRARQMADIVHRSPMVVFVWRGAPGWPVEFVSDNIRQFDYEPEEFMSGRRTWASVADRRDMPRLEAEIHELMQTRATELVQQYRIVTGGGATRWVEDQSRFFWGPNGVDRVEGIVWDITDRKEAEEAMRTVAAKLLAAREEERKRLASELHDSLGQNLAALCIALGSALPEVRQVSPAAAAVLEKAAARAGDLVLEVRSITHEIYPPTLEALGLAASLHRLGAGMEGDTTVEVECSEAVAPMRFGQAVEIALYRIAQEGVHNALKHSQGSRVQVSLECDRGRTVTLSVTDDGTGFDVASVRDRGMGLRTMAHRAEAIGGKLTIDSRRGCTKIQACIPLAR